MDRRPPMNSVLVVRPSSLGDVVHALSIVEDIRRAQPALAVDWLAEEAFAPLVALHPGVRRTIPVALRRWRHHLGEAATWREFAAFRADLRRDDYAAVIDLQEQFKGAVLARLARGVRHGPDRRDAREPVATWLHDVHHPIRRRQHFQDRCRQLAAAALGYAVQGPPTYAWRVPPLPPGVASSAARHAVLVHATSRDDKLWPIECWRELARHCAQAGIASLLPWGSEAERERAGAIAADLPSVRVLPRSSLPELAAVLRASEFVAGVDTGLVHLAAALGVPTVAVFVSTDPAQAGVARFGSHARDLGDGSGPPTFAAVQAAIADALRDDPRC